MKKTLLFIIASLSALCAFGQSTNKMLSVQTNNALNADSATFFSVNSNLLNAAVGPGSGGGSATNATLLNSTPGAVTLNAVNVNTNVGGVSIVQTGNTISVSNNVNTNFAPLSVVAALQTGSTNLTNLSLYVTVDASGDIVGHNLTGSSVIALLESLSGIGGIPTETLSNQTANDYLLALTPYHGTAGGFDGGGTLYLPTAAGVTNAGNKWGTDANGNATVKSFTVTNSTLAAMVLDGGTTLPDEFLYGCGGATVFGQYVMPGYWSVRGLGVPALVVTNTNYSTWFAGNTYTPSNAYSAASYAQTVTASNSFAGPAGSAGAVTFGQIGNPTNGVFFPSSNQVAIANNGAVALLVSNAALYAYGPVTMPTNLYQSNTNFSAYEVVTNSISSDGGNFKTDGTLGNVTIRGSFTYATPSGSFSLNNDGSATLPNGGWDATGNVTANSYTGNGSVLTSLNASSLASGQVPIAVLTNVWYYLTNTVAASAGKVLQYSGTGLQWAAPSTLTGVPVNTNSFAVATLDSLTNGFYYTNLLARKATVYLTVTNSATAALMGCYLWQSNGTAVFAAPTPSLSLATGTTVTTNSFPTFNLAPRDYFALSNLASGTLAVQTNFVQEW